MPKRLLPVILPSVFASIVLAQEPAPKPVDTTPEDLKALREARKISDPEKKIEALEKLIADHPKAYYTIDTARGEIGRTLLGMTPLPKERILETARKVLAAKEKPEDKAAAWNSLALAFLDRGVLLDEAQAFAREGLKLLDEKRYVERERKLAADSQRDLPAEAELVRRFRQMKGSRLATLGRIQLKQLDNESAEKNLRQAYKLNPNVGSIPLALAEIADLKFESTRALEYLAASRLIGGPTTAEAKRKLEAAYRRRHNDSLDGLEDLLDERYKKMFPPPVAATDYQPTAARTDRVVLIELFTGAGCPPCVSADLAIDVAMERYTRTEVALVAYHLHIPRPDPMTTTETQARQKFYGVQGVPSYYYDGERDGSGGPRENTQRNWDKIRPKIEARLETPSGAKLSVDALMAGDKVNVKADVSDVKADAKDVKLHIVLVQEHMRYSGENGMRYHAMVARAIAGKDAGGYEVDAARPGPVTHTFDLTKVMEDAKKHLDDYEVNGRHGKITFLDKMHEIDPAHLGVVVFAQDGATKEILQSQYVRLASRAISRAE